MENKLTQTIQDYQKGIQRITPNKSLEMFDYIIRNNFNFKNKSKHSQHHISSKDIISNQHNINNQQNISHENNINHK